MTPRRSRKSRPLTRAHLVRGTAHGALGGAAERLHLLTVTAGATLPDIVTQASHCDGQRAPRQPAADCLDGRAQAPQRSRTTVMGVPSERASVTHNTRAQTQAVYRTETSIGRLSASQHAVNLQAVTHHDWSTMRVAAELSWRLRGVPATPEGSKGDVSKIVKISDVSWAWLDAIGWCDCQPRVDRCPVCREQRRRERLRLAPRPRVFTGQAVKPRRLDFDAD